MAKRPRPLLTGTLWDGVTLARHRASPDPDAAPRSVALPAGWEREAAEALAALAPGSFPASLPRAAEAWIARALERGQRAGVVAGDEALHLAESWRALLLLRRGAPGAEVWRAEKAEPRFVLSLPAFLEPEGGFDLEGYAEAVRAGLRLLDALASGKASRLRIGFADLAGLLASLGLAYDSEAARAVAAGLAALTRGVAEAESGRLAARLGAREPLALLWPEPPESASLPGLAAAARAALDAAAGAPGLRHAGLVALAPPDAAEALLGAETGGVAPAAGATRPAWTSAGLAELPTRAALAASRAAPDRCHLLLAPVSEAARRAMQAVVAPFLHAPLPAPVALPAAPRPASTPRAALERRPGQAIHVAVGGHRVALRTAEDAAGRLREISFTLAKEGAAYRSLMDAFAQAVSAGLARGVPLADFVDAFAYTRFGPAGAVEGDPEIPVATSVLDWAFRRLALDHLGQRLPEPEQEQEGAASAAEQAPLLPLGLSPAPAPKRRLRVVA